MRDILFRGKSVYTDKWITGYYIGTGTIVKYGDEQYSVDPETVGQFTGMTDINGKRIFEGDIVTFTRDNALGYTQHRIGEVRYYDELPIFYIMATTGDAWDWCDCSNIKVIANAHDNPELLEVKSWTI